MIKERKIWKFKMYDEEKKKGKTSQTKMKLPKKDNGIKMEKTKS